MGQVSAYSALHHVAAGQEQSRGRHFNAFLAEVLRRGNLHDASSDQRGLHGRDEIDVHFTLGYTGCILEAKWERERVDATAIGKLKDRLETRRPGVQGFFVSMSGYTKPVYDKAEYHAQILLMNRQHVEAMVAGLFSADRLFHELLSVTSRRCGAYAPLADLLDTPTAAGEPLPALRSVNQPVEGFPAWPEAGLTVSSVLTADGPWTAGEVDGMAATADGRLLWTTRDGVLQVTPGSGAGMWTAAPPFCHGPALTEADGSMVVLVEEAAVRFRKDGSAAIAGGGFAGSRRLLPGPHSSGWVFASSGPRTAEGHGGHTLTQLAADLCDSVTWEVDFPGRIHQAVLTPAGSLYIAGGGHSVTTDREHNWRCPKEHWADSAPLTPDAALAVGDHTVLLAGRNVQGFEKAVYAVNIHDHTPTLLLQLPNTPHITGFAHSPDGTVYLLTDIRGNAQTPRPHLLQLVLPRRYGGDLHGAPLAKAALGAAAKQRALRPLPAWRRPVTGGSTVRPGSCATVGRALVDRGFFSLYDLVAGSPSAPEGSADGEPDDPRLAVLLRALDDRERAVVLARAHVATWPEAARSAGVAEPEDVGEKVRRKVRRLVAEQRRRAAQRRADPSTPR